jgi:hypothetical protein
LFNFGRFSVVGWEEEEIGRVTKGYTGTNAKKPFLLNVSWHCACSDRWDGRKGENETKGLVSSNKSAKMLTNCLPGNTGPALPEASEQKTPDPARKNDTNLQIPI